MQYRNRNSTVSVVASICEYVRDFCAYFICEYGELERARGPGNALSPCKYLMGHNALKRENLTLNRDLPLPPNNSGMMPLPFPGTEVPVSGR